MKRARMCTVAIACAALASAGTSSASPYVVADATPASPYVVASLPEPPNNIALSDTGVIAASLTARVKAGKLTVTGTTVSLRPLTQVAVYIKDLTNAKARFVKQLRPAFVSSIGTLEWNGKAPSKRFAVYVSSRGIKSNTVTVTARP